MIINKNQNGGYTISFQIDGRRRGIDKNGKRWIKLFGSREGFSKRFTNTSERNYLRQYEWHR